MNMYEHKRLIRAVLEYCKENQVDVDEPINVSFRNNDVPNFIERIMSAHNKTVNSTLRFEY